MGTHPIFESDFDCLTDIMSWIGRDCDRRSDFSTGTPAPSTAMTQLKPYPPDRYRPDCATCHAFENLFICCYKFNEQVKYMLPVLYCSLNCQARDFDNPRYPHRHVCQARQQSNGPANVEVETLRKQLNEERLRSNDISRDNSKLANRNTNFEKEIAQMQRDLDRQREERHKMQNEIDVARANTKSALEEAKRNEIRKDNLDMHVEKMKQRMADNSKLDREINDRQKAIENLKRFIQKEMELYLSYKGESQKKIEKLEMELQQYKDRLKEEDDSV